MSEDPRTDYGDSPALAKAKRIIGQQAAEIERLRAALAFVEEKYEREAEETHREFMEQKAALADARAALKLAHPFVVISDRPESTRALKSVEAALARIGGAS